MIGPGGGFAEADGAGEEGGEEHHGREHGLDGGEQVDARRTPAVVADGLDAEAADRALAELGRSLDLDAAKARAKEQNKVILAYFTRSYSP